MASPLTPTGVAAQIGNKLTLASRAIQTGTKAALAEAGRTAREEIEPNAIPVAGGDARFSRSRKPKLRVRVRVDRDGGARVSPVGVWDLAETGAVPHAMKAWGRGSARHPGTEAKQGRRAWSRGRDKTFERAMRQVPEDITRAVEEAWKS